MSSRGNASQVVCTMAINLLDVVQQVLFFELLSPGNFCSFQRAAYSYDILIEEPFSRSFQLVSRVIVASNLQLVNGFEYEG